MSRKKFVHMLTALSFLLILAGCDGPAEEAGEAVDQTVEMQREELREAQESVAEAQNEIRELKEELAKARQEREEAMIRLEESERERQRIIQEMEQAETESEQTELVQPDLSDTSSQVEGEVKKEE